jgi:hypothetical protein
MAFKKGNPRPANAGRKDGSTNKSTALAREAIASFVDGNADRLTGWLDRIAEDNPKAAFDSFMSVVEYHIPKLARTEHAGDKNNPLEATITVIERVIIKPNEPKL